MDLQIKRLSSLAKVFLDEEPLENYCDGEVFENECFSFALAYYCPEELTLQDEFVSVSVPNPEQVNIFEVDNVMCELPCYPDADEDYLRRTAGVFPDILRPTTGKLRLLGRQWRTLWFETRPESLSVGNHSIIVTLKIGNGKAFSAEFAFEVLKGRLPEQKLIFTQWLHYDCIAEYYNVKPMSRKHMKYVWNYVDSAVEHGMNMLLVPLVTPPLDTLPKRERPTMQLIDISLNNNVYIFNYKRLEAFLKKSLLHGIKYFEMTPLFTQWGAEFAPKVMASVNGEYKRIFGWDTKSDSAEYTRFLREMLTSLAKKLREWNICDKCFFHVSDEPQKPEHFVNYKKAYKLMRECLDGFDIMDTLDSVDFYKQGYVKHPIAATNAFEKLAGAGASDMWAYYCCAQYKNVSNHFIAMPSRRTRALGAQLYKQNSWGFLQWGFNFYNNKYSECRINPFATTDAERVFPAGDPFIVYPGENGTVISSIRQKVLREALYDNRAMQLLESVADRQTVCNIIDEFGDMTFEKYPRSEQAIVELRRRINSAITSAY